MTSLPGKPDASIAEQWPDQVRVRADRMLKPDHVDDAWADRLSSGDREGAWDAFLDAYRALIFDTIGRLVRDREDRMDAFALVCERLRDADSRRLRQFDPRGPARFSTWLVTVVRNLVVDWYRQVHGRARGGALDGLSELERRIYELLARAGMTYVEAYESLTSDGTFSGNFGAFLRIVRHLHREVTRQAGPLARELIGTDPTFELGSGPVVPKDDVLDHQRALAILQTLPSDVQVATLLFVVDDVPADEVARIVGWTGRKAVYNRVYRALALIRARLAPAPAEHREAPGP